MTQRIVIIGAGIVGVSAGIWLRRLGADVTIVDKFGPGQGTSFGNGGVLAACAMVPVTAPGLIRKAPKMLINPDFPLFMKWSYLPKLVPWLVKYLRHANDKDTRRIANGLTDIVGDSVSQHLSLTDGLKSRDFVQLGDYNFAYADRAAFDADGYVWELRREAGFVPELIQGEAVRDYDPAYGSNIGLLARMQDHGHILDPGGYVMALAEDFKDLGGTLITAEVKDVTLEGGRITQVLTNGGPLPCDQAILATGVWSAPLMKKLGIKVPIESERGYHIVFQDAVGAPRSPTMIASGKFVATPMSAGLRCAGVVEFGGLEAGPSKAPLELLRRQVKQTFPNLEFKGEVPWQGHRPATDDSLPAIGEVSGSGVFAAFGHHHIGLTGGPKTGRLVAQMIMGQQPNIDVGVYSPARWAG